MWDRSPAWTWSCLGAGLIFAAMRLSVVVGAGVAAFYLAKGGELAGVVAAATVGAGAGLVTDGIRRIAPWRRMIESRLAKYEDRRGDRAIQLHVSSTDVAAARKALRKAGYIVDIPKWHTGESVELDARWHPEEEPTQSPAAILDRFGISYRQAGSSVTVGPAITIG